MEARLVCRSQNVHTRSGRRRQGFRPVDGSVGRPAKSDSPVDPRRRFPLLWRSAHPSRPRHPPRGSRQLHRHHHRMVRFLPVRHGGGTGVQQAVLSQFRPGGGHGGGVRHLCGGLRRQAARRHRIRPLWRQAGAQDHAGDHPHDHGRGHLWHRAAAHLWPDRHRSSHPARAAAVPPGLRRGRRVGWRGADGGGAWQDRPARLSGKLGAGRRARGATAGQRGVSCGLLDARSQLSGMGLAGAFSARHRPAGRGHVHPPAHHRESCV